MGKKIMFYPGCTLKGVAKNLEDSTVESARVLGYDFIELPGWTCCGAVYGLAQDSVKFTIANVRNLIKAQNYGKEIDDNRLVAVCSMCYNNLRRAHIDVMKNRDKLETLDLFMDEEANYEGNINVLHYLQFLKDDVGFDKIAEKVKKPLKGLKVAPYYGCLLLRPEEIAIDDREDPHILEDLLKILGAEVVDYPLKNECCGSYHTVDKKEIVSERTYKLVSVAKEMGADVIATSCPLCFFNLDKRQEIAKNKHNDFEYMPIVYFTQLMAIAFGLTSQDVLHFDKHYISPEEVLKKWL
ncbi:CoB--CoM heterodisulfide reductase iron-sulfur subunit B family protein [Candidatus Aciduliprofundum boonei]|uniref:CoB--CoM heterodisulfide reductase n=1 Tax=Aciduliprofundum boonei (strain DSM 19572 / T469) TaxID=439481 RepID=B5ID69_ACIB4|nr:CoB--CoM heterodisulfide reductase iron-sulfur subunit B family protein [Candidatus Aciduliprofundum boonei]ADD08785.1 CoB--CoM heterodisulfide reductase [Aciduliprofundum boonei T469]EDY35728.1 Cysteine-rich domain protein [Aciduliprofundum boonei T469]HII55683.1 heterodisulfide reductase, subunit B [Candidatus Aciduliprofundum boonei]